MTGLYAHWMDRWERKLATRDTNRVVRPFDWGTDWLHSIGVSHCPPDANGNAAGFVISSKTGARARVGIRYVARFQAYIDDLENNHGARVLFMGGIRPGGCSPSSEHPCGKALDVCQLRRGVVDSRCKLPGRAALAQIAASHGLFEGGRWCNSDYGHAQVSVTRSCGESRSHIARKNNSAPDAWAQNTPALTTSY